MVIHCQEIWREISNYIEGEVDPHLRRVMEEHFANCRRCSAVLDGTRNVIVLIGDERAFAVPAGFSQRLHARLQREIEGR